MPTVGTPERAGEVREPGVHARHRRGAREQPRHRRRARARAARSRPGFRRASRSLRARSPSPCHGSTQRQPLRASARPSSIQRASGHSLRSGSSRAGAPRRGRARQPRELARGGADAVVRAGGTGREPSARAASARLRSTACSVHGTLIRAVVERGQRLAGARPVEAVPRAARGARDERALQQSLRVDDGVVGAAAQAPQEAADLRARRAGEQRSTASAGSRPAARARRRDAGAESPRTLPPPPSRSGCSGNAARMSLATGRL